VNQSASPGAAAEVEPDFGVGHQFSARKNMTASKNAALIPRKVRPPGGLAQQMG
jgi:hypothetical protein